MTARKIDVDGFWRDGYTIIRNVFTPAEIEGFRESALASKDHRGDLLSNPKLQDVLLDGRLVDIAREILGENEIFYFGDSSCTIREGAPGWHKDCADRSDPKAPDWQSRYTLLRFGVYLQDYWKHSGGLNLRAGSHEHPNLTEGKNVYVRTKVGDVGVWSFRITHSAAGSMLRFPRSIHPLYNELDKYPKWLIAPKPGVQRISLFAGFGLDDSHSARFVDYLKSRTYGVGIWKASVYDEETLAKAEKVGLKVRDVRPEVLNDDTVGKNVSHASIPY